MKISARNVLAGTVKEVRHGVTTTEVTVSLAAGVEVVSVITKGSAERLDLRPGVEVRAVIKATDVMLATEV